LSIRYSLVNLYQATGSHVGDWPSLVRIEVWSHLD